MKTEYLPMNNTLSTLPIKAKVKVNLNDYFCLNNHKLGS